MYLTSALWGVCGGFFFVLGSLHFFFSYYNAFD